MKLQTSLLLLLISYQMLAQSPSVHPGDFNMDGRVSVNDVLYLGQGYDEAGLLRPNATLDWLPQDAPDWGDSIRKVDFKYIDGNGDGMIDTSDLEAVLQNYDSTHTEMIKDSLDDFSGLDINHAYVLNGGIIERRYDIDLKGAAITATGGLVLTLDYSSFEALVGISVDTTDSWLEPDILFVVDDTINQRLHVAITRTDQTDRWDTGEEVLFSIFICEDVASLTNYVVDTVKFFDIEKMNSTEGRYRYFLDTFEYAPIAPLDSVEPLCRMLWNGERCQYRNGLQDGDSFDMDNDGFRGDFSDETFVSIGTACRGFGQSDTLLYFNTLQFCIKVNGVGLDQPLYFDIDSVQSVNISDFIEGNVITADYKLVSIPIDMLGGEALTAIEWLNFRTDTPLADFHVDVDLITANNPIDTLLIWTGEQCTYTRGRLNSEEAYQGNYCFEAIPYLWPFFSISLACEKELAWRQDLRASDSLVFYAKADTLGKEFEVFFFGLHCAPSSDTMNVLDYIEGGLLDTAYRKVSIPISEFQTAVCLLSAIQFIVFSVNTPDFIFYIDDIHVVSKDSEDEGLSELCEITSVVPPPLDPTFSIYPNPLTAGQSVNIRVKETVKADIQLTDITGKIYYRQNQYLYARDNQLDIHTDLPSGMYFLTIFDEQTNKFDTQKLLIMNR